MLNKIGQISEGVEGERGREGEMGRGRWRGRWGDGERGDAFPKCN